MKRRWALYAWAASCTVGCSLDRTPSVIEGAPVEVPAPASAGDDPSTSGDGPDFGNPDDTRTRASAPVEEQGGMPGSAMAEGGGAADDMAGVAGAGAEAPVEPEPDGAAEAEGLGAAGSDDAQPATTAALPERFAACASDGDCVADETCIVTGDIAFCAQACRAGDRCEGLEGGRAPICGATFPDGEGYCRIPCDLIVSEDCPGSMVCSDPLPAFPAGTGSCGHPL